MTEAIEAISERVDLRMKQAAKRTLQQAAAVATKTESEFLLDSSLRELARNSRLLRTFVRTFVVPDPTVDAPADYPVVALDTEAGDCTAHFGHQLHAAPPPTGEGGRVTLYIGYCNPALVDLLGPGEGPNDILFRPPDTIVPALPQVA